MQSQHHDRDGLCPVHSLAKSIGDKPMSEITFKEQLILSIIQGLMANPDVTYTTEVVIDQEPSEVIHSEAYWDGVVYADRVLEAMARLQLLKINGTSHGASVAEVDDSDRN